MDWWHHVALDILSSAANSTNKTGSSSLSSSKSNLDSPGDLFATHLAQSQSAQAKAATAKGPHSAKSSKQPAAPKSGRDKTSSAADKRDASTPSTDESNKSAADSDGKSVKGLSSKTGSHPGKNGSSSNGDPASDGDAASADGSSAASDAAAASESGATTGTSSTNGPAKGRATGRAAATKTAAPQVADAKTSNSVADPSADASNTSGLSLLQLLAHASDTGNSAATATDGSTTAGTDSSTSNGDNSQSAADPTALALAMISQAFAAGFANSTAANLASAQGASGTSDSTTGTTGAIDVNGKSSGAPMQDLVALLAKDLAAQAQGKTDDGAAQSDVAATKNSADNSGSVDNDSPTATTAAQTLAQLGAASHFSRDTNMAELKAPVGSPAWNEELGGHLTWMSHRGLESGSLRVSPEHLGPVEVQISVQNGDASVWFGASHPDTRAALEQALPRLREMFANQGLTLTDSGVSREPPRNQTRSAASQNPSVAAISGSSEVSTTTAVRASLGLIDTYA
jgi:flagellar hook-length control protein FliK